MAEFEWLTAIPVFVGAIAFIVYLEIKCRMIEDENKEDEDKPDTSV